MSLVLVNVGCQTLTQSINESDAGECLPVCSLLDVACSDSQSVVQEACLRSLRSMAAQPLVKHVSHTVHSTPLHSHSDFMLGWCNWRSRCFTSFQPRSSQGPLVPLCFLDAKYTLITASVTYLASLVFPRSVLCLSERQVGTEKLGDCRRGISTHR